MPAVLYLVGTPIGNLEDISLRALATLREVDLVAAEDTRRTGDLLRHYGIEKRVISCYQHNQQQRLPYLQRMWAEGKSVALVTDAGMPGISDPGEPVVAAALQAGVRVVPIPGPNAALAALVVSGLPTRRFVFEGFLPRAGKQRRRRLRELTDEERTLVFYESPYRLQETLADMMAIWGERPAVVARELTKIFEEVMRGRLSELTARLAVTEVRGEIVIIVGGKNSLPEETKTGS